MECDDCCVGEPALFKKEEEEEEEEEEEGDDEEDLPEADVAAARRRFRAVLAGVRPELLLKPFERPVKTPAP